MAFTDNVYSRYLAFFENLTNESVDDLRNLTTPEVRYRDPFADAKGIDEATAYMHNWFQVFSELHFIIGDYAIDLDNQIGFGDWIMKFRIRRNPEKIWEIEGVSKTTFNKDGKVVDHIDYWDPSPLFESVPFLGRAVTLIKRRLSKYT